MTNTSKIIPTPEMIAAAWAAWNARHGGKLGPGPAFREAIEAALAAAPEQKQSDIDAIKAESAASITPQMIRDTAIWETIDEELRDELLVAADALEAAEKEVSRLRRMVERRDEFIISNGLFDTFKEARDAKN